MAQCLEPYKLDARNGALAHGLAPPQLPHSRVMFSTRPPCRCCNETNNSCTQAANQHCIVHDVGPTWLN
eukprot:913122-Amphidinium_carterae.1